MAPKFKWLAPGGLIFIEDRRLILMPDRDPLLQEREKTNGSFERNAKISQELKRIFHDCTGYYNDRQLEALDMIALKLSRILSGQADFKDHWDDIAGYAKLASEACNGKRP